MFDSIDNATLSKLQRQPDVIVLDVRTVEEYEQLGHIPGAVLFPMDQLPVRLGELPTQQPLIVICQHGVRSAMVCHYLIENSFKRVFNHLSGMSLWDGPLAYGKDEAGQLPNLQAIHYNPLPN